jgi:hypothetical protein
MAKRRVKTDSPAQSVSQQPRVNLTSHASRKNKERIIVPTGDRRHMTAIRLGKISNEIFSRKERHASQNTNG